MNIICLVQENITQIKYKITKTFKLMNNDFEILNYELLHENIRKSSKSFTQIARECGISRDALYTKVNGDREFKVLEYALLCKALGLQFNDLLELRETQK